MATRPIAKPSNRPLGNGGGGNAGNSVDVGILSINRTLREDTRWFIVGVVVLSIVLFFALPLSVLVYIDAARLHAEVKADMKQMKRRAAEVERMAALINERAQEGGEGDASSEKKVGKKGNTP